ncbi:hypothetical protein QN362_01665 [Actimicrobium sp. CCC2.4]|uniref:hypothetical protein n=1 Tax=Actimicrobium sp. CCC2.4 TaxID=3048606 RepID=UPI002AC9A653|nr:hypothetical protein [Actimicrobium sp. CCC2.4]MEB0134031.1 hypothetical protein [Actimicrobium sp. CCC2.4]WPX31565.1 hypothetical protein RHM62_15145 [Actimicrobium sp. CCC2.4]
MKHRHYGVVVGATLLALAVFWQIAREVRPTASESLVSKLPAPATGAMLVPPSEPVATEFSPSVSGASFATPPELLARRKAGRAQMDERLQLQPDANNHKQADHDARRKAPDDVRQAQDRARTEEAELRQRQDELTRQQKATAAEQKSPQQVCADRPNFISRGICEAYECEKSERLNLPFCIEMHERRAPSDYIN